MATLEHLAILAELKKRGGSTWADRALRSCLEQLVATDSREISLVQVFAAWTGPGDTVSVVYVPPWGTERIGIIRNRATAAVFEYPLTNDPQVLLPEEFGEHVAKWDIGEPFGIDFGKLWRDSSGLHWWGDLPFVDTTRPKHSPRT